MTVQGVTCAKKEAILPATVIVVPIRAEDVDAVWLEAAPFIRLAQRRIERNVGMSNIYEELVQGQMCLWLVKMQDKLQAVIITRVVQHPRRRAFRIEYVAGKSMTEWLDSSMVTMRKAAQLSGCSVIEADGRRGWTKIAQSIGFKEVHRAFDMEITDAEQ